MHAWYERWAVPAAGIAVAVAALILAWGKVVATFRKVRPRWPRNRRKE